MHLTLDGFAAGPEGQLDWMQPAVDPLQLQRLQQLTESMDTILMGRKMTDGFTTYWENVVDSQPDSPEYPYAKIFVDTPKIVFSKTLKTIKGRNVTIENGDLVSAVNKLKNEMGKDLIVFGGAEFVSELIANKLIDELHLFINPVAIGSGLSVFRGRFDFKLVSSLVCGNGLVVNQYEPLSA